MVSRRPTGWRGSSPGQSHPLHPNSCPCVLMIRLYQAHALKNYQKFTKIALLQKLCAHKGYPSGYTTTIRK